MLMIRLQRVGRKNDPSFRVVVVNHREAAQTGKVIEVVGSYDPRVDRTELKADQIKKWISQGAQVSGTVNNILVKKGIIEGKTTDVSSKKLGKKATAAIATQKATEEKKAKEAEVKAKAEAEVEAKASAKAEDPEQSEGQEKPAEEKVAETPAEPVAEEIIEEKPAE